MPQNELLDAIFRCFEEYNYWPMKALRARLKQPEAYIRETLDICAEMAKSGRFAMLWTLKPSYKAAIHEKANEGAAPDVLAGPGGLEDSDMGENDGEDDDDDIKMEDVLPE
jgi:transcription initiation factor TFIIF subunit beta